MKQPVQAPGGSHPTPRPNNATSNPHAQQQQQHHRGQQQEQPIRAQQTLFINVLTQSYVFLNKCKP